MGVLARSRLVWGFLYEVAFYGRRKRTLSINEEKVRQRRKLSLATASSCHALSRGPGERDVPGQVAGGREVVRERHGLRPGVPHPHRRPGPHLPGQVHAGRREAEALPRHVCSLAAGVRRKARLLRGGLPRAATAHQEAAHEGGAPPHIPLLHAAPMLLFAHVAPLPCVPQEVAKEKEAKELARQERQQKKAERRENRQTPNLTEKKRPRRVEARVGSPAVLGAMTGPLHGPLPPAVPVALAAFEHWAFTG